MNSVADALPLVAGSFFSMCLNSLMPQTFYITAPFVSEKVTVSPARYASVSSVDIIIPCAPRPVQTGMHGKAMCLSHATLTKVCLPLQGLGLLLVGNSSAAAKAALDDLQRLTPEPCAGCLLRVGVGSAAPCTPPPGPPCLATAPAAASDVPRFPLPSAVTVLPLRTRACSGPVQGGLEPSCAPAAQSAGRTKCCSVPPASEGRVASSQHFYVIATPRC